MDAQPPEDLSTLRREVRELQAQMAEMQKRFSELTKDSHQGYYENTGDLSQGKGDNSEVNMPLLNEYIQQQGRDKDNPPNIPHIMLLQCVRCKHMWQPRSRSPKKCPSCKAPWWFMPRWRWGPRETPKPLV